MNNLKGSTALVTGAGRCLGAALAVNLADHGCDVILAGRQEQALQAVSDLVQDRIGKRPETVVLDLASPASVETAVSRMAARHTALDILVNNGAAYLVTQGEPYSAVEVQGVIGSALTGTFLLTQGLLPVLHRSARPDIVTIGSVSGLPNAPLHSEVLPFYAAKHGQAAMAEGLRQMLAGTPVRSICIHPPYLDDIGPDDPEWATVPDRPKGSRATNRDVVEAVVFALTRPRHITLASLVIDADAGGLFSGP